MDLICCCHLLLDLRQQAGIKPRAGKEARFTDRRIGSRKMKTRIGDRHQSFYAGRQPGTDQPILIATAQKLDNLIDKCSLLIDLITLWQAAQRSRNKVGEMLGQNRVTVARFDFFTQDVKTAV